MRILSKPNGIEELIDNLDLKTSLEAILSLNEPKGIVDLKNKKDELFSEMIKYHYEMSQNGFLSHDSRKNLIKFKTLLEWIYLNPSKLRKTDYIDNIRKIYAESGTLCPYCGVSPCRTLDHYYNKALLPQFSFLPENLIPCCGDCNKDKGSKKSFSKWRRFVNPFYDDFSLFERNEPLIYIIFKESPQPLIDMEYVITANHNLGFIMRKQINYHIRTVKIPLWHHESISNSFWRNAKDLIGHRRIFTQGLISEAAYNAIVNNFIEKNEDLNYDWEYIVRYSLVKLKVNGWIYSSGLRRLS